MKECGFAPDWRVGGRSGDLVCFFGGNRQNGLGVYGKDFRMTAVAVRNVEKIRKKRCSECFENSFGWDNIQSFWQILVVRGI